MQKLYWNGLLHNTEYWRNWYLWRYYFEFLIPNLKKMNFNTLWWEICKGHLKTWKMRAGPRRVKQTFPVLFISQAGLIKELPMGWQQVQGALLITKEPQSIQKTQPLQKNPTPLASKKPQTLKNTNQKSQPSYQAFFHISFSVTS